MPLVSPMFTKNDICVQIIDKKMNYRKGNRNPLAD